jgi:hypothetical protein
MADEHSGGWGPFIEWAVRFYEMANFDEEEREYKFRAIEPLMRAREMLADAGPWQTELHQGLTNNSNNLVSHWVFVPFLDWLDAHPEDAAKGLRALWLGSDQGGPERIEALHEVMPKEVVPGRGSRCNLFAYLLGALDPLAYPNYRITAMRLAFELTRTPPPDPSSSPGALYEHAIAFFDEMVSEARARGLNLRDRLDAQSLMWCVTQWQDPPSFTAEQWDELLIYRTIPSRLRLEKRGAGKPSKSPVRRRPHPVCPLCAEDQEVTFIGPVGDRWEFVCEAGPGHSEPYEFSHG